LTSAQQQELQQMHISSQKTEAVLAALQEAVRLDSARIQELEAMLSAKAVQLKEMERRLSPQAEMERRLSPQAELTACKKVAELENRLVEVAGENEGMRDRIRTLEKQARDGKVREEDLQAQVQQIHGLPQLGPRAKMLLKTQESKLRKEAEEKLEKQALELAAAREKSAKQALELEHYKKRVTELELAMCKSDRLA